MKCIITILVTMTCIISHAQPPLVFTELEFIPGAQTSNTTVPFLYNGSIFFGTSTVDYGHELYVSDGTLQGSKILHDINPLKKDAGPSNFVQLNGKIYFIATDDVFGRQLWVSDGTGSGTNRISNFTSNNKNAIYHQLAVLNNKLIFAADDGVHGRELWVSDGTTNGTQLLKDIFPGKQSGVKSLDYLTHYAIYNNKMYFAADDSINGLELWVTDGTATGTQLFKDLNQGPARGNVRDFYTTLGKLFFYSHDSVTNKRLFWATDGTLNGTQILRSVDTGGPGTYHYSYYTTYNGKLYFASRDTTHGNEIWVTDGTPQGTTFFIDILPGSASSYIVNALVYDSLMYFGVYRDTAYAGLWVTDGTPGNTKRVAAISTSKTNPATFLRTVYKGYIYGVARDTNNRYQLFRSNGTDTGTTICSPVNVPSWYVAEIFDWPVINGALYLHARSVNGLELWKIEDTTSEPAIILTTESTQKDIKVFPNPASDRLRVTATAAINDLLITNTDGKIITAPTLIKNDNTAELDISNLPAGLYFIHLNKQHAAFIKTP